MEGIKMHLKTLGKVDLGMTIKQNSLQTKMQCTRKHTGDFGRIREKREGWGNLSAQGELEMSKWQYPVT